MRQTISGTEEDNNKILSFSLAEEVKEARYNKSSEKVLDELGIEVL